MIYLDTHAVCWLHAGLVERLPPPVRHALEAEELLLSPAVVLELQYLYEIARVAVPAPDVVAALGREIGLRVCSLPFPEVISSALTQTWTRDPFDRLIAAQAAVANRRLATKDGSIREHSAQAFWD